MSELAIKQQKESLTPDGWSRSSVGEICQIIRGVTYKKAQATDLPEKGYLPILRATNIQNANLVLDEKLVYVPKELVSEKQQLQLGDIVIATSSGSKHLVGKTAQVKELWSGSFGAFCAAVRPQTDVNHRYLGYFFESPEYRDFIAARAVGVNINNLRRGDLEDISVPLAPRDQQDRIVAEIEKQFSRLDQAVASLKRVKANLKRYKAAVLKAAVEGKLTEEWRKQNPDVEPASKLLERILAERRAKWEEAELAKMKARGKVPKNDNWKERLDVPHCSDQEELFCLPEGWIWTTLDTFIYSIESGKSFKCEERPPLVTEIGVAKVSAVSWGEYKEEESKTCLDPDRINTNLFIQPGNFLFSRANTIELVGACVIVDKVERAIMLSDKILRFSLVSQMESWVLNFLRSTYGRAEIERLATGNQESMRNIGQARIRSIRIPMPPIYELVEVVERIEGSLSVSESTGATLGFSELRANRLKQSILGNGFSGLLG